MTDPRSKIPGNDPDTLRALGRDYDKQTEALLFAAPIALLAYSFDKAGNIGICSIWETSLWFSWFTLSIGSVLAAYRMLLVPKVWAARATAAANNATEEANKLEGRNRCAERAQLVCIALGFILLFIAQAAKSLGESGGRAILRKKEQLELEKTDKENRAMEDRNKDSGKKSP